MPEISPMPSVFKDTNPNATPDARYKAIFWSNAPKGMAPFKSPDGIHWSPMTTAPANVKASASLNVAFWDDVRGEYRAFYRSHIKVDPNASQA
ncbi:MAG: hypothetical protein DMG07_13765 [Acidobacteria bacterium]|nr:MAG: hypothetical protein DMG07_13765 [Acidobacteriota bacterium]